MAYIPTGITSIVNTIPSSVQVGASVMGHAPVVIVGGSVAVATGNSSVQVLNPVSVLAVNPTPASVQVLNPVSVLAVTQSGAPWANTNVGSIITVSQGSVAVNIIAGSVTVATGNSSVQVLNPVSILATTQSGIRITSLVSTVPSSVIVGASIFGQLPAGTAPIG